jgi:hydroxymethylglutaryl-CoA reductase
VAGSGRTSQISGFYALSISQRLNLLQEWAGLSVEDMAALEDSLSVQRADKMTENVSGRYALPVGIATNFLVNGKDYLVPMAIEEPSVVAGASFAAKLFRAGGGFRAEALGSDMIGQIQILDIADMDEAERVIRESEGRILRRANFLQPGLAARGGGAKGLEIRKFRETSAGPMMILHILFDTVDAMGANAINSIAEGLAPMVQEITGRRVNLRILSNLADRRMARAEGTIPAEALSRGGVNGEETVQRILEAAVFAEVDPYRAATHNKGIMNGVDAVAVATGNDWRALEAGAHAYAARSGCYTSLTRWRRTEKGDLAGSLEMPLAVGIVGGSTQSHPTARVALKVLGVRTAAELAQVMAAVGLAQNLAALRALATEGIQRGHMALHARQVAAAAGASPDEADAVAGQMVAENNIRSQRAADILAVLRSNSGHVENTTE